MTTPIRTGTEQSAERRNSPRHATERKVKCHPLADAMGSPCIGTVLDISAEGMGLVMQRWVAPETTLAVTVLDADGEDTFFNVVRVKHILFQQKDMWTVGGICARKFSDEELKLLQ